MSEKLEEILSEVVKQIRYNVEIKNDELRFKQTPQFNDAYLKTIELWEGVKVHSEGQDFPDKLFKRKAPNETTEEYDYRRDTYEPVTKATWNRGIANYDRVFNEQNFDIDWGDDEYFTKEYPLEDNILTFYKSIVKDKKLEDANAVMVLAIENPDDPDNIERNFFGDIMHCPAVLKMTKRIAFLMSEEKSVVEYAGRARKIGFVFLFYTENEIIKISQTGKFLDWNFGVEVVFQHDFGYLPVQRLKGFAHKMKNEVYYESRANSAVYPLNEIAYDNSTLQASKVAHAYLEKWQAVSECPNPECTDGRVQSIDEEQHQIWKTCSVCEGTNKAGKPGVLGTHEILIEDGEESTVPVPPAGFIDKSPEILTFLRSEIEKNEQKSFDFLGVDISNSQVRGTETALGKIIDREALENALLNFSNEIWDLLKWNIKIVNDARGVENKVIIKEPKNFTIRTEKDLTEEFGVATDKGLPDAYLSKINDQLVKVRFGNDENLKKTIDLKQYVDRLFLLNREDTRLWKAQGMAQQWEINLHTSYDTYVARELQKNPNFLNQDPEKIKKTLEKMAMDDVPEPKGTTEDIIEDE